MIDNTLGVVDVAIFTVTAHSLGMIGIVDIDHVQATGARLAAYGIGKAACFIDGNVVGIGKATSVYTDLISTTGSTLLTKR